VLIIKAVCKVRVKSGQGQVRSAQNRVTWLFTQVTLECNTAVSLLPVLMPVQMLVPVPAQMSRSWAGALVHNGAGVGRESPASRTQRGNVEGGKSRSCVLTPREQRVTQS